MTLTWFDYLIKDFSDEALEFCVEKLYDVLNFRYLPKDHVGIDDLREKLNNKSWCSYDYIGRDYMRKKNKKINSADRMICSIDTIDDFVELVNVYINSNVMQCGENSRALRYKNKAKSIIAELKKQNESEEKRQLLDDLIYIFIWQLRRSEKYFKNPTGIHLINVGNLLLNLDDANNIARFFIIEKTMPNSYKEILKKNNSLSLNPLNPDKAYHFENDYGLSYNDDDIKAILDFMYIYFIIFLCRNLQKIDGFKKEENSENGQDDSN